MTIDILTLGAYQVKTYILSRNGGKKCLIIDPGYDADVILDRMEQYGLEPEAILSCCRQAGETNLGLLLYEAMQERGLSAR